MLMLCLDIVTSTLVFPGALVSQTALVLILSVKPPCRHSSVSLISHLVLLWWAQTSSSIKHCNHFSNVSMPVIINNPHVFLFLSKNMAFCFQCKCVVFSIGRLSHIRAYISIMIRSLCLFELQKLDHCLCSLWPSENPCAPSPFWPQLLWALFISLKVEPLAIIALAIKFSVSW